MGSCDLHAVIKMSHGKFLRSLRKLCFLEVHQLGLDALELLGLEPEADDQNLAVSDHGPARNDAPTSLVIAVNICLVTY